MSIEMKFYIFTIVLTGTVTLMTFSVYIGLNYKALHLSYSGKTPLMGNTFVTNISAPESNRLDENPIELQCLLVGCTNSWSEFEGSLLRNSLLHLKSSPRNRLIMAGYTCCSKRCSVTIGHQSSAILTTNVLKFDFRPPLLMQITEIKSTELVHIIVGVSNRRSRLLQFLDEVTHHLLPRDPLFVLHILYTEQKQCSEDCMTSKEAILTVYKKLAIAPNLKWTMEVTSDCGGTFNGFSRGCVLNRALRSLRRNDLVMLSDVDVMINYDALIRCRVNTSRNRKVYFPVVFSLFNPNGPFSDVKENPIYTFCDQEQDCPVNASYGGFWRSFGFGMVCAYKEDISRVGGMKESYGWGGEDVDLYNKLSRLEGMEVLRGPEPGMVHLFHHKRCAEKSSRMASHAHLADCLKSKTLLEGNRKLIANKLICN